MPSDNHSSRAVADGAARTRSVTQVLYEKWRDEVRKLPPAERCRWLKSSDGIAALGARNAGQLARDLDRFNRMLALETPSSAWHDDAWCRDVEFPPGRYQTSMIKSAVSGRYTPPQMLDFEDQLDSWSPSEAYCMTAGWGRSTTSVQLTMLREGPKDQGFYQRDSWPLADPRKKRDPRLKGQ